LLSKDIRPSGSSGGRDVSGVGGKRVDDLKAALFA